MISSNKLNEIKKASILTYDKKNNKLYNFNLSNNLLLDFKGTDLVLGDLLTKNLNNNQMNELLRNNTATNIAFTHITSSDNSELVEKILLGEGSLFDLYKAREIEGISLRDLYFIYSFSGGVDSQDKKETFIKTLNELDKEIKDIYIDSQLGKKSPSITIVNSSQINGLGKKYTRIITNLGGRVVDTSTGDEAVNESFLIYKESNNYNELLLNTLGIKKSLSIEEVGLKYPEIVKSDLVIVLGIDKSVE